MALDMDRILTASMARQRVEIPALQETAAGMTAVPARVGWTRTED
jgi:hypothetical protein